MSIRFAFGNKKTPVGNFNESEWMRLKPEWKQIRTTNCVEVVEANQACGEVDALWTRGQNLPIAVTTADCVPILLHRKDEKAIGVIHAGWEGTIQRIVPKFFSKLPPDVNEPRDWVAKIGPSIRACCYQFGDDLLKRFYDEFKDLSVDEITPAPRMLDLIAILKHELAQLGVEIESVDPRCTYCSVDENKEPEFLSYRRGDRKSRQLSLIMK